MLDLLKLAWKKWMRFAALWGNFMSGVILVVFYFTIFPLFALPFRFLSKPLNSQSPASNWIPKKRTIHELEEFKYEY